MTALKPTTEPSSFILALDRLRHPHDSVSGGATTSMSTSTLFVSNKVASEIEMTFLSELALVSLKLWLPGRGVNGYPGARLPVACSVTRAVEMRMEARLTLHGRE